MWSVSISHDKSYHHGNLRTVLIEVGIAMLQEEGVEALSLRMLAKRVGVSHNAPYMHFADKEALLAAIAEQGFLLLADHIQSALELTTPDEDWLVRFHRGCRAYVMFMFEHKAHAQVMFHYYDSAKYPDLSRASANTLYVLESWIQQGQAAGYVAPGESRRWTTLTWSLLHGIFVILNTKRTLPPLGDKPLDTLINDHVSSLYLGLKPRPDEP